ncbi:DUF4082 domain-containing protein [Nonomuraea cavernae]|uniref:DUF4082 domain-containing protein n=1 Tax=Nonomuraea cavernae TaxID=2045107 RepID=A0A917YVI4_9ACTN|nr:DUF4082 domain-containing protein [Nonomuraea cavernae]MCA2185145.1 DUF4082 domain-containing protein [Nonomuraea cavernae]GGO65549.1 hypothetical protein GCM10012289_17500 [Nonomuraea cavernae]
MRESQPQHDAPDQTPGPRASAPPASSSRHLRSRSRGRSGLAILLAATLSMGAVVAMPSGAHAIGPPVDLGDAADFAVLASTAVSNTNQTALTGDLGVSPGTTVSGFPPGTVSGDIHQNDAAAVNAKADVVAAYNDLASRAPDATVAPALGGTTKTPGVYASTSGSFAISGTLTLDAEADPDAIFVFKATSLTAANVSNINLVGGAQEDNVFWQVTGTASLGTYPTFRGNVLASGAVTVGSGSAVFGRVFSINNVVTLQGTDGIPATRVTVPNNPPTTTTLTSSPNPSATGEPVTFTATVDGGAAPVTPAGDVVFKDGATVIGTDRFDQNNDAQITVSDLGAGQHHVVAVYLGGTVFNNEQPITFAPSTSPVRVQNVTTSLWNDSTNPAGQSTDDRAVTLGVKFTAGTSGLVEGVRFFKGPGNTGPHVGSLWTSGGQLLASGTFTGETPTGWQQLTFSTPVAINADTTYVASYHTTAGLFSLNRPYFTSLHAQGPLTALQDGAQGGNGVYTYGATNSFPTSTFRASNYWVDIAFTPSDSLWSDSTNPAGQSGDDRAVTLGVKFRSISDGLVQGIRFHKRPGNSGPHVGSLWTSGGQLLASGTFTDETPTGWQEMTFSTPVAVNADTTYVASYHTPTGQFSVTNSYFTEKWVNGPLTALEDGFQGGNGVFVYGAANSFPTSSHNARNYWVDVLFVSP